MIKIGYVNPPSSPTTTQFNYVWMLFKCFYEDYGKYSNQVEWVEPVFNWDVVSLEEIVQNLHDCDIVLFTSYVWNYELNKKIANCLDDNVIKIIGGPQQDENIIKVYDHVADPLAPGELFIQYFIDLYIEGKVDKNVIPFYRNSNVKLPYNFGTSNVYKRCSSFFEKEYNYFSSKLELFERLLIPYETTRGCPFQCVYCEWGGGTGTKVLKKPMEIIQDELEFLGNFDKIYLDFCDANTGMFKERDRKIVQLMRQNNLQIGDTLSILKTLKVDQKKEILDFLIEHDVTARVISLSLQSISEQARDVAKRKDLNLNDTIELMDHLTKKWDFKSKDMYIDIELILGMPGSTLDDFYEEFKLYQRLGYWEDGRYPYMILPATEIAKPEYQKQYKIKTSKVMTRLDTNHGGRWDNYQINPLFGSYHYEYETIIECFSYTFDDFIEMYLMNWITPMFGNSWLKEYVSYENISEVAKELWSILNKIPIFLIYKELAIDSFLSKDARSIDRYDIGELNKNNKIEDLLENIFYDYEETIRKQLDEFCKNL